MRASWQIPGSVRDFSAPGSAAGSDSAPPALRHRERPLGAGPGSQLPRARAQGQGPLLTWHCWFGYTALRGAYAVLAQYQNWYSRLRLSFGFICFRQRTMWSSRQQPPRWPSFVPSAFAFAASFFISLPSALLITAVPPALSPGTAWFEDSKGSGSLGRAAKQYFPLGRVSYASPHIIRSTPSLPVLFHSVCDSLTLVHLD